MGTTNQQPESPAAALPEPDEQQQPAPATPNEKTPREFYAEVTRRDDVQVILQELASES